MLPGLSQKSHPTFVQKNWRHNVGSSCRPSDGLELPIENENLDIFLGSIFKSIAWCGGELIYVALLDNCDHSQLAIGRGLNEGGGPPRGTRDVRASCES